MPKDQVRLIIAIIFYEVGKHESILLGISIVSELISFFVAGASSARSSVHTFQSSEKSTVEVGDGNVKLSFSTYQGKITNYVNSRSLVCNAPNGFIIA